jgi:hypothetical protein
MERSGWLTEMACSWRRGWGGRSVAVDLHRLTGRWVKRGLIASSVLLVLAACQTTTAPGFSDLVLRVDPASIALNRGGGEVVVPFTVRNRGGETVLLARCGDDLLFELQRSEQAGWVGVRAAICLAVYDMSPLPLAAGETVQGGYRIDPVPGRYRLVLGVRDWAGDSLPLISDPFTIE